jgi:transcriptional regulator with XRE-family HTH domain
MLFADKIRQLRDEKQMLQRHFAAARGIDTPLFNKIEYDKRHTLSAIANILNDNETGLLTVRLANRIIEVKKELAGKALIVTQKNKYLYIIYDGTDRKHISRT